MNKNIFDDKSVTCIGIYETSETYPQIKPQDLTTLDQNIQN